MPKFITYQRPAPVNRNAWSGRPGGPLPAGKSKRTPKPAPEAAKVPAPPGVEITLPLPGNRSGSKD